ncbi:MAG: hypothetical protein M0R30_02190 [Methanoregula sp.]|uniref:hypothetical protein n=1 Tax=Methanoregula sp. TaxID=2052170 RepID=UPI0025FE6D12|nr:hypothetical protein [Methanoregula sp.]MCK9630426.1 hypothetical protein [Methanoregula sp.]
MNTDSTIPEDGRNRERQPPAQNPCSDVALLRIPHTPPGTAITGIQETVLFAHPVNGRACSFYLCYLPGIAGEPIIRPLADRYEAAAFIIGKAGRNLAGVTDAERRPIRECFPDIFGRGNG